MIISTPLRRVNACHDREHGVDETALENLHAKRNDDDKYCLRVTTDANDLEGNDLEAQNKRFYVAVEISERA